LQNAIKFYRFTTSKEIFEEEKIYTNFITRAQRSAQSTILELFFLITLVTVNKQKYKR